MSATLATTGTMRAALVMLIVAAVVFSGEAKRKRKFEGDFEFAEEVSYQSYSGRWNGLLLYGILFVVAPICATKEIKMLSAYMSNSSVYFLFDN